MRVDEQSLQCFFLYCIHFEPCYISDLFIVFSFTPRLLLRLAFPGAQGFQNLEVTGHKHAVRTRLKSWSLMSVHFDLIFEPCSATYLSDSMSAFQAHFTFKFFVWISKFSTLVAEISNTVLTNVLITLLLTKQKGVICILTLKQRYFSPESV